MNTIMLHLCIARKIYSNKIKIGIQQENITSFSSFPGNEQNYLRAQIARISASTLISPVGYYKFRENDYEEEDGEEMDEDDKDVILKKNEEYDPPTSNNLLDSSMSFWCYHSPYIQKQGRVIFWNPYKKSSEKSDISQERIWLRPLTPLSNSEIDGLTPWSIRQFSKPTAEAPIILVRSNIWPGAYAYATEKQCGNIYIGWGHKVSAYCCLSFEPIIKETSTPMN